MNVASITAMVTIHGLTGERGLAAIALAWNIIRNMADYLCRPGRSVMQSTMVWYKSMARYKSWLGINI
jgi:hypothetical protein